MRKRVYLCLCILILSIFVIFQNVADVKAYGEEESVFDYAELLSVEEENLLREYTKRLEEEDIAVIFLTTADAEGKSATLYSDDFYDTHAFGEDGVLFMIDMDNREIYINTVGLCIDWLEDDIDAILDESYAYASDGQYYRCLSQMSERACTIIETRLDPIKMLPSYTPMILVIAGVITGIVMIIVLAMHFSDRQGARGEHYLGSSFEVNSKDIVYMGCRQEVIRGYYARKSSSGGSGSHRSSGGVSHGGGGRRF